MTGANAIWTLPGPMRLLGDLCDQLFEDRVVSVRAPAEAVPLAAHIELKLNEDGQVRVVRVTPAPDEPILDSIADATGTRRGPPAALVTSPELADSALIVVLQEGRAPEPALHDPARLASRSSRMAERLMMIIGGGHLAAFGNLPLERIASLPIASAVRPDLCVPLWHDHRTTDWIGWKADWASGCSDDWGGMLCEHPLWLAANRPEMLTKRVWRGQVAVLLPWIETRRLEIIARYVRRLRPERERSGPDVEALDWGPLGRQLGSEVTWLVEMIETHRQARNELAHGRPLSWPQIANCLKGARKWFTAGF